MSLKITAIISYPIGGIPWGIPCGIPWGIYISYVLWGAPPGQQYDGIGVYTHPPEPLVAFRWYPLKVRADIEDSAVKSRV